MSERLSAAAAVVLRDADDAHPRDVVRNAIKELVAAGAWRIEHAVVKNSFDALFDRWFDATYNQRT